jgi:hypothetical protein
MSSSGKLSSVALKGPAWKEPANGNEGTKGWGKNMGATASKVPDGQDATVPAQAKIALSETTRGFPIPSSDTMYNVDRV